MANDGLSSEMVVLEGLPDVENYTWENDGEGSLPSDRYSHLTELMQCGNKAFRENHFEDAISYYSRANSIKPGDPVILGNRAAAFCRISQFLKQRSASDSECRPLNGLDPTMHAELALKDAEKVMSLSNNSVGPYILKANALILLEKYDSAHDVILSGLQVDPFSNILQESLKNLETTKSSLMKRTVSKEACGGDFDCTLCLKLLYEPVTTPCGHSFCRLCLLQSMDRGNKCPLCRTVLFVSARTCAISVTLKNIIQKSFPEEYAERKSEHDSLTNLEVDLLPLFVMDVMIPCQKSSLHIFEPRYRLMVRRIMEGNHRMGMVIPDSIGSIADFGCEVEITECEPLPDGRFYLEIESRRRFCILNSWDQDGYRVAKVEWIQDDSPELLEEKDELQALANNAAEYARAWLTRVRESAGRDRRRLERLLNVESLMPTTQDPERFSFWLTTLTDRRPEERLELLTLRDTKERLRRGLVYLSATEQVCRLQ